jgi:hypothetical protein
VHSEALRVASCHETVRVASCRRLSETWGWAQASAVGRGQGLSCPTGAGAWPHEAVGGHASGGSSRVSGIDGRGATRLPATARVRSRIWDLGLGCSARGLST